MTENEQAHGASGFAIGYGKEKGNFRVYVCLFVSVFLLLVWLYRSSEIALALAVFFGATGYYFYPLIETDNARLGAGEYGIFIEGFGVIPWRSIESIELNTNAIRTIEVNELTLKLAKPLPDALIADWRSLPYHRLLMKLPWTMTRDNTVRINLEPFSRSPDEIVSALQRCRRRSGST